MLLVFPHFNFLRLGVSGVRMWVLGLLLGRLGVLLGRYQLVLWLFLGMWVQCRLWLLVAVPVGLGRFPVGCWPLGSLSWWEFSHWVVVDGGVVGIRLSDVKRLGGLKLLVLSSDW